MILASLSFSRPSDNPFQREAQDICTALPAFGSTIAAVHEPAGRISAIFGGSPVRQRQAGVICGRTGLNPLRAVTTGTDHAALNSGRDTPGTFGHSPLCLRQKLRGDLANFLHVSVSFVARFHEVKHTKGAAHEGGPIGHGRGILTQAGRGDV